MSNADKLERLAASESDAIEDLSDTIEDIAPKLEVKDFIRLQDAAARVVDKRRALLLAGAKLCVICLDEPRSHIAVTCFHLVVCRRCSRSVSACPVCRADTTFHEVYIS